MASTDRELEQQLKEAGNKLLQHPSSVDGLVFLLDQVENFLSRVEQSPPKSMLDALAPSLKALVEDELLRHSDSDVKVGVASCISEITRITAPDAPYTDDKMKDVFQLIVSSFENLADKSSRSFNKRASILETVSKVRSCVVMLDLECDGLIVEMFQHFLKSIRDYHPENVFTSMEIIMTLVLEESEDISQELLNPLLASVKKSNEEVLPIARRLGERVFVCCADKLKPYLVEAVNSSGVSLDEYSKVVASICEGTTGAVEHNDGNAFSEQLSDERKLIKESSDEAAQVDENKLTTASSDDTPEVVKESVMEEACPEEIVPVVNSSPRFVMSNGVTDAGIEEKSADPDSANQLLNVNLTNKGETDDSDAGKLVKLEIKPDQTSKRRGRKPYSSVNSTEHSDSSRVVSEKEAEKHPDRRKSRSKDVCSSPQSVEAAVLSENEKETTTIQLPSPKALESESVNVASPPPSGSFLDESHPKKGRPKRKESSVHEVAPAVPPENEKSTVIKLSTPKALDSEAVNAESRPKKGRPKKKESLTPEVTPSVNDVSVKASDATSDSEVKKPQRHLGKKPDAGSAKGDKILTGAESSKNEDGATSDSEEKPLKQSGKKKVVTSDSEAKPLKISVKKKAVQSDSEEKLLKVSGKKKVVASDSEEKLLKKSGKKVVAGDSEVKTPKQSGKKGDASDSEAKTPKQSGKKGVSSDLEAKTAKQLGKKGVASDSEAKTPTQSVKGGASKNIEDKPSLKKKENGKRRERGKDTTEKDLKISSPKDDEMVSSPKSAAKSAKDEDSIEETPKSDSKRKRTPGTGKDKVPEAAEYGENLVGLNVKVWWPKDRAFYEGVVESFDSATKKHKVLYNDGDVEVLNLRKERWERIEGDPLSDGKQSTEDPHLDSSSEMPQKKKAKTSSDKQEKMPVSPKRDGAAAAASSKSKGTTTKSSDKSKDHSKKKSGGKSVESKQDSPKTVSSSKSKGKSSGSGSKSNANKDKGAKVKESKEESAAKSPDTESESKTGKKRRRGAKA